MAIKLIAIDMDGTLLLPDHTISPAVKNAIAAAREKGVNVVLTTGRPYAGVHSYLKELHMNQPGTRRERRKRRRLNASGSTSPV